MWGGIGEIKGGYGTDAPREDVAALRERDRVEGATHDELQVLALERGDGGGHQSVDVVRRAELAFPPRAPEQHLV